MLIDTHFHLDLIDNMMDMIHQFQNSNIGIIAVGTTPVAYKKELQFASGVQNIKIGLGFHPQLIQSRFSEVDLLVQLLTEAKYIGEIGLDFNSGFIDSKYQQISCFRKIVTACADAKNKVLSIHSVKSTGIVLDELESAKIFDNCICILHWFTGTVKERSRAIECGAYFSINPRMAETKSGQELIKSIPANKILLETDAPFTWKPANVDDLEKKLNDLISKICLIRREDLMSQIDKNCAIVWNPVMLC